MTAIERATPAMGRGKPLTPAVIETAGFYGAEYRDQIDGVLSGRVCLHGREIDFGSPSDIDWKRQLPDEGDHQMWRVKLGHMGFLSPMLAEGGPEHHAAVAHAIAGFRERTRVTDPGSFNAYWFPYGVSHRILALASGLLLARAKGGLAPEVDALVSDFLRENVAFLLDNVEHELRNNHVERNLAALSLYFSHVDEVPPPIAARLERDIAHLVSHTILPDGAQVERSPMYQGLSVVSLAVMSEAPFLSATLRETLTRKLEAARFAFAVLCHPDGEVALFNDSWHEEVPRLSGPKAPEGRSILEHGGYARLSQADDVCILDAGPLGPRWNPGHGHADFLSIEITLGGQRLVVDPGTSRYNTGPERARERSAEAHNGPVWSGHEPAEFLGCFKVGRMAEARLAPTDKLPDERTIGGVFPSAPGRTARLVRLYPGAGFLVADLWGGAEPRGQVSWLVPDAWGIEPASDRRFLLRHATARPQACIEVLSEAEVDAPRASFWASHYGRRDPAFELRVHPRTADGRQHLLCWIGHAPPPPEALSDGEMLARQLRALVEAA
ncbi:heparinase II/III family protein [Caulobacter sp. CCH9-E1]|uniref:heparinase II/III family protein n=1 Tax=Caulobacter sp. CCH9-E1 TaxID=1768768 RepID=UPI0008344133|nr:heparinase II/III family protein [Caulobacter sp. CCH9-E1]